MDDNSKSLERRLETHRRNLHKLEEKKAFCGLDVPLKLLNEIEHEEKEIARLEEEIARLEGRLKLSESAEDTGPKQRVQIYLQGDFSSLSADRRSSIIDALTGLLGVSTEAIEVYRVHRGSIVFDLGIPSDTVQRLRSLLQSNNEQLRLLKVEKVILVRESGEIEEWVIKEGKYDLATSSHLTISSDVHGKSQIAQQQWVEAVKKLPTWVSGAIGLATTIISFVALLQGNYYLGTTILGILLLIALLRLCLYVGFAKTPALIVGGKGVHRFPKYRPWALTSIAFIFVLVCVSLVLEPSRSFVVTAFIGTATPTPTATSTPTHTATPTTTPSQPIIVEFLITYSDGFTSTIKARGIITVATNQIIFLRPQLSTSSWPEDISCLWNARAQSRGRVSLTDNCTTSYQPPDNTGPDFIIVDILKGGEQIDWTYMHIQVESP